MSAEPVPFDVAGPIPLGTTTLIEASAGTGKTYTLAALAVRLVAEHDVPIERILIVTFTRAATAELRDRIRRRLVEAELHLRGPASPGVEDPVLAALDRSPTGEPCSEAERHTRGRRLSQAVTDFDAATVSTIHGFCSQVRSSMGVLSEHGTDATTAGSETDLVVQVCADLYFRELHRHDTNPLGTRSLTNFVDLVKKARTLGDSHLTAASHTEHDVFTVDLVKCAVREVDRRLRLMGGQSFDSLLTDVRDALRTDHRLVDQLRRQFPVALIDEFQDTDPVQWEIFSTLFGAGAEVGSPGSDGDRADEHGGAPDDERDGAGATSDHLNRAAPVDATAAAAGAPGAVASTLFLVGDPKQAIYAFRGGDVYTYLEASSRAHLTSLTTNQRSDEAAIAALNALAAGHRYGEPQISYQRVDVAPRNIGRRAVGAAGRQLPGLVVRCLEPDADGGIGTDVGSIRRAMAADLAVVAHELISSVRVLQPGEEPGGEAGRPVRPGDIAVLVGATTDATPVANALRKAGIPVVLRLRDDVADSDAREQWRTLLHALDRPASVPRAAAAALTWFFDWDAGRVTRAVDAASATDEDARALVELQHQLADWNAMLEEHGIAALFGEARRTESLAARLLGSPAGERNLTDLEHLAELIHAEARERGRGLTAGTALAILDALGGTPEDEVAADAAQRRVESDADAVQIMTIHGSKGLEFPFVLLPSLWAGGNRVKANRPFTYYDADRRGRVIDLSSPNDATGKRRGKKAVRPEEDAAAGAARRQNCGDQHRLTYVALTRSKHQTVVWWTPDRSTELTGVTRMLLGDPDAEADLAVKLPDRPTEAVIERVRASGAGETAEVVVLDPVRVADPASLPLLPVAAVTEIDPEALREQTLDRRLDRTGRMWSFSSMSRDLHVSIPLFHSGDPSEEFGDDRRVHDEPPGQDRPDDGPDIVDLVSPAPQQIGWERPSPYHRLGGGRDFGNLVHHLLEMVDFSSAALEDSLGDLLTQPNGHRVTDVQRSELPSVLAEVIRTPLGSDFRDLRLADLSPSDRLNELGFHFALAPERPISASLIGSVVADHLDADDPLQRWAEALRNGLAGIQLQGFLNGSIDLTLRQDVDGTTRYSVLDYKTNDLAPGVENPTLTYYRHPRLLQAMADNQYALQALIYSVALHRYLRWRVRDYDPAVHLGPVGYLFVRGMVGADTPTESIGGSTRRAGVFTWQVPHPLVESISSLFAGHEVVQP